MRLLGIEMPAHWVVTLHIEMGTQRLVSGNIKQMSNDIIWIDNIK